MLLFALIITLLLRAASTVAQGLNLTDRPAFACSAQVFGKPNSKDCASVLNSLPDVKGGVPTPLLDYLRSFIEPQQLKPPFRFVKNGFGAEARMEQLPRFWRSSKSDNG